MIRDSKSKNRRRLQSTGLGALALAACAVLGACGGAASYADGTYEGKSEVYINDDGSDEGNGYGVVTITIKDGLIAECVYETFEEDGTLKGEDYGKQDGEVANKYYYNKAQKAVAACEEYAAQLVESGSIKEVDAISGATVNYNEFAEAVNDALNQAKE